MSALGGVSCLKAFCSAVEFLPLKFVQLPFAVGNSSFSERRVSTWGEVFHVETLESYLKLINEEEELSYCSLIG